MLALFSTLAFGQATCDLERLPALPDHLSVVWVAPRSRRVRSGSWLTVVPTLDVMDFAREEEPTVGRLLEHLGQRRSGRREPRRAYKVMVFDVAPDSLCRPIDGLDARVVGVDVCEFKTRHFKGTDGCGFTVDTGTRRVGPPAFRARWADLVKAGFCLLPAERFLQR